MVNPGATADLTIRIAFRRDSKKRGPFPDPFFSKIWTGRLLQVEPVEIHDFIPGGNEILNEFFLAIVAGVDFGDGAELGV